MRRKEPLYRKVNTRTHGVHHERAEYRWIRNTKQNKKDQSHLGPMHRGRRLGLDYTPLFRFLLSRVGDDWTPDYSEAASRLDRPDPIFWIVARSDKDKRPFVRIGESSYYSGL